MTDLVAFLRARLDEDEAFGVSEECAYQQDPGRVLREVEAKRAILARHPGVHRCDWGEHWGGDFQPCLDLRILAAVYSDHPDYDPDWT